MLIDWFTVDAQALNFLILVYLLKRYLYRPILDAIDAREQRIAKQLADADAEKNLASKQREEFRQKNEAFDRQRAAMMSQATEQAKAEGRMLVEQTRQAADIMRQERLAALNRENQGLNREISRLVQDEVMALTRKTLRDLAGTTLEDVVCDAFLRRIGDQDSETKAKLALTVQTSSEPAQVRSAFPLTAAQQDAIRHALNSLVAAEMLCRFEVAPELIGGIELLVNGQKLAWSIGNYLDTLEKSVAELISKQSGAQIKPEAESAGDEESK